MQDANDALLARRIAGLVRSAPAPLAGPPVRRDCAGCGVPIPGRRLRAMPGAKLCIGCRTLAEEGR